MTQEYTDDTPSTTPEHNRVLDLLDQIRQRTSPTSGMGASGAPGSTAGPSGSQPPVAEPRPHHVDMASTSAPAPTNGEGAMEDGDEREESDGAVALHPHIPLVGPSILMPKHPSGRGRAEWHRTNSRELPTKMRAALKAGRVKRNRYVQPIDVIVSYAGSEATMASEPYDVIDGEARGMLARQVQLASTLQRAVGSIADEQEGRGARPLGVSIISTLSNDDHSEQVSPDRLGRPEVGQAIKQASRGRISRQGALRPLMTDVQGKIKFLTAGQGITLGTLRTGKIGGGKSLTAYASTSPRDSMDRQIEGNAIAEHVLRASPKPMQLPPIISIGGTSFDKYLATLEAPPNDLPPGVYQYVTTTPQHLLPHSVAGAASRKKIESMVALACIAQGAPIDNIPIMMLNMKDRAVAEFVELEILRYVLETHKELQPATVDRSDVITYMEEFSTSIGKQSRGARLVVLDEENPEEVKETIAIQERELFLGHATTLNRTRVAGYATGSHGVESLDRIMQELVKNAFAQAYGRSTGDIILRDSEVHRKKLKMIQVVLYLPDDLEATATLDEIVRLENALSRATTNAIGHGEPLPVKVTTYRVPMENTQEPVLAVRCMTHVKDVLDMIVEDTPELFEKVLANVGLDEWKQRNVRGTGTFLENRIFRDEVKALRHERHREIVFFRRWADQLELILNRIYRQGWQPRRRGAFDNGLGLNKEVTE